MVNGFYGDGIDIASTNDSVIGCYIGTNAVGTAAVASQYVGIDVEASGATIGGTTTGAANIISGNTDYGVVIDAPCLVEGNDVGTNAAGTAAVANYLGIYVDTSGSGATIGGTTTGAANIISGNTDYGVNIWASCLVEGNFIGTNAAGTAAVANGLGGIGVGAGATIGGTATVAGNVISGNTDYGLFIGQSCLVEGNEIGTNAAGTAAVANGLDGIAVVGSGATIGGTTAGAGNIISGNTQYGVDIDASSCLVEGNEIGTNAAGDGPVANGDGIYVFLYGPGATIGGTTTNAANIISGNTDYGVYIDASSCLVEGNDIGTNAAGTAAMANGQDGAYVTASGATIGGTATGAGNVISGNTGSGVEISGTGATGTVVAGNLVGLSENGTQLLSNGGDGIEIDSGATGNTIGGTASGAGNVASGNGDDGIEISGLARTSILSSGT